MTANRLHESLRCVKPFATEDTHAPEMQGIMREARSCIERERDGSHGHARTHT